MDHGPGLVWTFLNHPWTLWKGVAVECGLASKITGLLKWLADLKRGDIVSTEIRNSQDKDDYVYCKIHFSSVVVLVYR